MVFGPTEREERRAPCQSIGRPALPLLPEGPDQHTVRKGDPPAGDQTLAPMVVVGNDPGVGGRRQPRLSGRAVLWWPEALSSITLLDGGG